MREFAILMFIFAAAVFLYGFAIYKTRNYSLIPNGDKASVKNKKRYARQFGKVIMWVAITIAAAGLAALLKDLGVPVRPIWITLIGNMILFIAVGIRVFMHPSSDGEE